MNTVIKYEYKGTPGEYKVINDAFVYALHLRDGDKMECNRFHARLYPDYGGGITEGEVMATATLFAASPLLLSALIKAVEFEEHKERVYKIADSVHAYPTWYAEAKSAIEAALNLKTVEK